MSCSAANLYFSPDLADYHMHTIFHFLWSASSWNPPDPLLSLLLLQVTVMIQNLISLTPVLTTNESVHFWYNVKYLAPWEIHTGTHFMHFVQNFKWSGQMITMFKPSNSGTSFYFESMVLLLWNQACQWVQQPWLDGPGEKIWEPLTSAGGCWYLLTRMILKLLTTRLFIYSCSSIHRFMV